MTIVSPNIPYYDFRWDNFGVNPAATLGTSITPGTSNAYGSWTAITTSTANVAVDCEWMFVTVSDGATSGVRKNHMIDIGVDPAGGTSYSAIISNIVCGSTGTATAAGYGHRFLFPFSIKAGSNVAVRAQGSNTTAGTLRCSIALYGRPNHVGVLREGRVSQTLGANTSNTQGVTFAPGNASDGSWVSLGTTSKNLWWWQLGYQVSAGTITAEYTYIDLAWGDSTTKRLMSRSVHVGTTGETCGLLMSPNLIFIEAYCRVPSGSEIYVRGRCNNAPDVEYNAVAIGIGG